MNEQEKPRKLRINMGEMHAAMDNAFGEMSHYLDLETGEVLLVMNDTQSKLEAIYDETDAWDPIDHPALEKAIQEADVHDWQKEALLQAHQIEIISPSRYVYISASEPYAGYNDMEDFIFTVDDDHLREVLYVAIQGKGAFRRFKDVLLNHPDVREKWFEFSDNRERERVRAWLAMYNIEAIEE